MENDYRASRERASEERIRRILEDCSTRVSVQNTADRKSKVCAGAPLAMVYSPYQEWRELFDLEPGFCRGTIFKELDKPFLGAERNGGVLNG